MTFGQQRELLSYKHDTMAFIQYAAVSDTQKQSEFTFTISRIRKAIESNTLAKVTKTEHDNANQNS